MEPIRIVHFSDVLCVWAYVGGIRLDELVEKFGERIVVERRFCSVFGDAQKKLEARWRNEGGLAAYGAHVRDIVARFGHLPVHPDIWLRPPPSSLAAHLFLCAVRAAQAPGDDRSFVRASTALRLAFFRDAADVSARRVQFALAEELTLPRAPIEAALDSGVAAAELSADYDLARAGDVTVSPTLHLNEGRQRLNGNVGYRVIEANVQELVAEPRAGASWC